MTADSSGLGPDGANRVLIRFKPEGIETSEERPRSLRSITGRVVTKTLIEDLSARQAIYGFFRETRAAMRENQKDSWFW